MNPNRLTSFISKRVTGKILLVLLNIIFVFWMGCSSPATESPAVQTGLDRVNEFSGLFENQRVGIISNHTAVNAENQHISDVFLEMPNVTVTALFGPEHGFTGTAAAGIEIDTAIDTARQIPVYSLYGETRKPTPEMLKDVDVLVFDIQDVGARFYTYIYTMALAMEAAAEQGKAFVVLDRPNPITGTAVEGNILEPEFASFVGLYPLPVRYGMTSGELAQMINGEGWLADGVQAELTVVPLNNWRREMWYDETGLAFIKPSPNIPDLETATIYPGLCLVEGVNVSEGRGTMMPFRLIGAPWIDGAELSGALNGLNLPGVSFQDTSFTPVVIPGMAEYPKYRDRACSGVKINVTERDALEPYFTGIQIISTIKRLYPDSLKFRPGSFQRLSGTRFIQEAIENQENTENLPERWKANLDKFMEKRQKYLIYD